MPESEFFPPSTYTEASNTELETALQVAKKLGFGWIAILGYTYEAEMPSPWFCFDVGDRKFAIWRETGNLYNVDKTGAVNEDPITIAEV